MDEQPRSSIESWAGVIAADLRICLQFATRVPLPQRGEIAGPDIARASWALPIVGALIGLLAAVVYGIAFRVGLAPLIGTTLTVGALLVLTGCLHEDGLADTCDGLGGGTTRERKLEIMRDSRIGTYGAGALVISLLLRIAALAALAGPAQVAWALIAAQAGARAMVPLFLRSVPPARADGLSAGTGRPPRRSVLLALLLGFALLLIALGTARSLIALLLLLIVFGIMRRLCLQQIGGQTGDTVGTLEQASEIVILLVAAAGRG